MDSNVIAQIATRGGLEYWKTFPVKIYQDPQCISAQCFQFFTALPKITWQFWFEILLINDVAMATIIDFPNNGALHYKNRSAIDLSPNL